MRRFGAMKTEMQTMAVQTEDLIILATIAVQTEDVDLQEAQRRWSERSGLPPNIVAPPNLLVPDKKIWMIPPRFFTSLGNRCGRWGPIAGFKSKSWTARQLKSEILPTFLKWDMLVEYATGWLAQFFRQRDLSHVLLEGAEENRRILNYKLVTPCSSYPCSNGEERVTHYHGFYRSACGPSPTKGASEHRVTMGPDMNSQSQACT